MHKLSKHDHVIFGAAKVDTSRKTTNLNYAPSPKAGNPKLRYMEEDYLNQ